MKKFVLFFTLATSFVALISCSSPQPTAHKGADCNMEKCGCGDSCMCSDNCKCHMGAH